MTNNARFITKSLYGYLKRKNRALLTATRGSKQKKEGAYTPSTGIRFTTSIPRSTQAWNPVIVHTLANHSIVIMF
uniref:Uncharacterized protein n=1 Tax=Siphoviridae sp. ctxMM9 TaxID=2827973 RepID=A0A8S5T6T9_9CAUD|nr:MAG TPA: hypothetical protein [Siphoviridae sp. ctxMM9]